MAHHTLIQTFEDAAEKLSADLHVLAHMLKIAGLKMAITYDDSGLIVSAPSAYKAYVPKRYLGIDVSFRHWEGKETEIDVDTIIQLQKHGIYIS